MPDLKIYKICPDGLLHFIVPLQRCSIGNLLHLLKINEVVEPMYVSSAILCMSVVLSFDNRFMQKWMTFTKLQARYRFLGIVKVYKIGDGRNV